MPMPADVCFGIAGGDNMIYLFKVYAFVAALVFGCSGFVMLAMAGWQQARDYARARQGGVNCVIENVAAYGYEDYNGTVKQLCRMIETFYRVLDANHDKMDLALMSADARRIVAKGKLAVFLGIEAGFEIVHGLAQ